MGELLICNEPIAAMPYYIEGISWNVYSLEELCYYIENNTYLLEKDFMTEELCTWIGQEVHNLTLAERLRDIMRMDGRLSEFVLALLIECGYCPRDTIKSIVTLIREMEDKSDFECNKVRADRLMEKEKYLSSIYEYKSLLESNEAGEQKKELIALFDEFEAYETPESKFAHVMDNLQPLMLNNSNGGSDWQEHQVSAEQVYKRQSKTKLGSEKLFEVTDQMIQENIQKGSLKG